MNCQNCGRHIDESLFPQNLVFCPYCGQNLRSASEETERLSFCPYCGLELSEQTTFCPHCGKKLKAGEKRFSGQKTGKALLGQGKVFLKQVIKPTARAIRNAFSSEKKTHKLFEQWSEYSELPPDEVPSIETLREMTEAGQAQHSPRRYLIIGAASLIVIVVIVILISRC